MNNDSGLAHARAKILARRAKLASEMDRLMADLRLLDDLLADLGGTAGTAEPVPQTSVPSPTPSKKVGGARMHAVGGVPHPESRKGMMLLFLSHHPEGLARMEIERKVALNGKLFREMSEQFFPLGTDRLYRLNPAGLEMAERVKELRNSLPATPAL
jgi:hypothetical protein